MPGDRQRRFHLQAWEGSETEAFWTGAQRNLPIIVSWAVLTASISGQALFRQAIMGPLELGLIAMASVLAGMLLGDLSKVIVGFFVSFAFGFLLLYFLATLPAIMGLVPPTDSALVQELWIVIMLRAFFPFPLIGFLVASLFGGALGERLF